MIDHWLEPLFPIGILLDLGISSFQLNSPNRGFSYSTNGPLDMRFDLSSSKTVSKMILESSEEELAFIIRTFGEERYAKNIAKKIKQAKLLQTTMDLAEVIRKCTPPAHRNRSYARVFQALRIAVNQELDRLKNFLENCLDFLLFLPPAVSGGVNFLLIAAISSMYQLIASSRSD